MNKNKKDEEKQKKDDQFNLFLIGLNLLLVILQIVHELLLFF
ncbi:hypothetical protein [Staphylococcus sp. HMSC034G07]|nr:hypothetical protein [Staphylococcus sp. HMSC034G07]